MSTSERENDIGRCASDLTIDRLLVDELDHDELHDLEDHTARCPACKELIARRRQQAQAFCSRPHLQQEAAAVLARWQQERQTDPQPLRKRPRLPLWFPLLGGLAMAGAAAALLLLLLPPKPPPPPDELGQHSDRLRIKGGFSLTAFVKRGPSVTKARSGETFFGGDVVRFAYTSQISGYLALVGVDAGQVVTLYHPARGETAVAIAAGVGQALPGASELDETLGQETVIGVLCPRPFTTITVTRRAREIVSALRRDQQVGPGLLPQPRCRVARFELNKKPR